MITRRELEDLAVRLAEASRLNVRLAEAEAQEAPASKAPTVTDVVDQLNALRAGRSFKEAPVLDQLKRYYEGLADSEKQALFAYTKGLAQIVSGQVDAGAAEAPREAGVEMTSTGKHVRTIKPNVIRRTPEQPKAASPVDLSGPPKEDRTPPMPIVPKKR